MRFFDLFLRRAGLQRGKARRQHCSTSRLTVVCSRTVLGDVRKQICLDFSAAGLDVARFQVDGSEHDALASACVTVQCPPERRRELMRQARRLRANPSVHDVHFDGRANRRMS